MGKNKQIPHSQQTFKTSVGAILLENSSQQKSTSKLSLSSEERGRIVFLAAPVVFMVALIYTSDHHFLCCLEITIISME